MRKSFSFFLGILSLILAAGRINAGPVNTPQSYPFAASNSKGDTLTLGDVKGLFMGRALSDEVRSSAFKLETADRIFPRFSGGLAETENWEKGRPFAIACSNRAIALFDPQRSAAYPGGRWNEVEAPKSETEPLQCAMQGSGDYAWLSANGLTINGRETLTLPFGGRDLYLLAAAEQFLVLAPDGRAASARLQPGGQWTWSALISHPFKRYDLLSRFAANAHQVLRADADGVWLARLEGERWGPLKRISVNPCGEEQACGVSLAPDDSWLVSGYWGHFLGRDEQWLRLPFPLAASETFGVAIAHRGLGGSFIYLGTDDGDQGILPNWKPTRRRSIETEQKRERWMVWSRRDSSSDLKPLTEIATSRDALVLSVWNGPLPSPLPQDWLAWEAEETYTAPAIARANVPADPWWQDQLGSKRAQDLVRREGIEPALVHVAIVDSGIDPDHPWLSEQRFLHPGEIAGNGLDDDGNGFVDDVWGYDFVEEDAIPQDTFGHGTHVAGLLMARRGDQIWTAAPNLRLTVVRALDRYGKSNSIDLARALIYAMDQGAEIINCSWGGGSDTQALRDVFALARERGVGVIASAGNDRLDTDVYPEVPKNYPGLISVGSVDQRAQLASFTNYGSRSVSWFTPGTDIVSTLKNGDFGSMSGTSMSAPLATASLAWIYGLLAEREPALPPRDRLAKAEAILCGSADSRGLEKKSQCGRIRLDEATRQALAF